MWVLTAGIVGLMIWMFMQGDVQPFAFAVLILVLFIMLSFSSLTVSVDAEKVMIWFGWGLFRKCFAIKEIRSAKKERHPWYHGWGIRVWFWPYRWTYNIWGYEVVELHMKNGRIFRIGTDEPDKLEKMIKSAVKHHNH